jgi:hypothetical protein
MHELNFLPLSYRKNVTMPTVIIQPNTGQNYDGYYSNNTIVAVENEYIDSILAHEFRHHLQHYYGCQSVIIQITDEDVKYVNYDKFIRKYFRSSWSEMDALLFEHKITPNWVNTLWLKKFVLPSTPIDQDYS